MDKEKRKRYKSPNRIAETPLKVLFACVIGVLFGASSFSEIKPAYDAYRIPDTKATYQFPASSLKIYGDGEKLKIEKGLAVSPKDREAAWILKGIKSGNYYVGVYLSLSQSASYYGAAQGVLLHDGRKILFNSTGKSLQFGKAYVAEFLSAKPLQLKNGDELRINRRLVGRLVGPLNLYAEKPLHGVSLIPQRTFSDPCYHDLFRISTKLTPPKDFNRLAKGEFSVFNALTIPQKLNIKLKVVNYFMSSVFELSECVEIGPKESFSKKFEYPWGSSDRYMAVLDVTGDQDLAKQAWDQILTPSKNKFRCKDWINDGWSVKPVKGSNFVEKSQVEGGKWTKINLPFSAKRKFKGAHVIWYKKQFKIPEWMNKSKRFFLNFCKVGYDAEIWLNGKKIHYNFNPHAPFKVEITKYIVKNTENELLLGTRDKIASLDPKELKKKSLNIRFADAIAPGGRPGVDEVYIEGLPESFIDDAMVTTSFRKKEVDVAYDLADLENKKYSLESAIYFNAKKVFAFDNKKINDPSKNKDLSINVSGKWDKPILWSPWVPKLLRLETKLKTADGKTLDVKNTRFGFREIWCDGTAFLVNGVRVKMGAIAMARYSTRKAYRNYIKLGKRTELIGKVHMHTGQMLQDVNDEEGLLVLLATPQIGYRSGQKFECDEYWKNAEKIALESVKAYWNHPSIIAWELSNEWARQNKLAMRRLRELGMAVKKIDPTRLALFSCDLDLNGWNDHISTHYPVDRLGVRQNNAYLPDSALWYPTGTKLKKGMKIPCGQIKSVANIPKDSPIKWGDKPIFINECGWKLNYFPPHGFASVFGDWCHGGGGEAKEAHIKMNRWFLSRHRDIEATLITPWLWCDDDPFTRIIPQIDIVPMQAYSRWYGGEKVSFRVNLHCDRPEAKKLKFTYAIIDESNGETLFSESEDLNFQPAELKRVKITLPMPEVNEDTKAKLVFKLVDDNGRVFREEILSTKIFAPKKRFFTKDGVVLFDPEKKSHSLLKAAGVDFQSIEDISPETLKNAKILIVGRDAAQSEIILKNAKRIEKYVAAGGTVLILNQSKGKISWTPVPLNLVADKKTSITFRRAPRHPVLHDLDDEDLKFWYPGHLVSQFDYLKPSKGNFITLIDAGNGPDGMEFCSLLEMPCGEGCYMVSQLEFNGAADQPAPKAKEKAGWLDFLFGSDRPEDDSDFAKNPLAEKILHRILDYLSDYQPRFVALGAVVKADGEMKKKLDSLGVKYKLATKDNLNDFSLILVEMDALNAEMAEKLRNFAENGGEVLLHKVSLKTKALANVICDGKLRLFEGFHPSFTGRLLKTSNGKILDGLGNADFFWKKLPVTQAYEGSYGSPKWAKGIIIDHPIDLVDGEIFTFPGALGKIKLGEGSVLIDQINWDSANHSVMKECDRIASVMLTNLGCEMRKNVSVEIPDDLEYKPLNISKHLNRSLKDDVNNDGKGGWTDQGAERDFRKLKPGMRKYNGVPFRIEKGKSCLVLRSKYRKATVPEKVLDIPIGKKADVIYFLQSSAWTSRKMGVYRINYENGEFFDIELAASVNMRDWSAKNPEKPFYNEAISQTKRAFTYYSYVWPKKRSIYMMAWVNPKPKLKIKSFDFISANNGVPVLLAVTLANVPKVIADIEIVKGDRKKALELFAKAQEAFKNKEVKKAEILLIGAIKADMSLEEAHSRLGRCYSERGALKKAEKQFRIVLAINEKAFDVYFLLGAILEKQKRYKDALRVYQKSFDVDDNQPRIIDAREKMLKKLGK